MKNLTTPNAKSIKTNLRKFYGVSALRCSIINGRMFLNIKPEDKKVVDSFLNEFGFCHSTGSKFISANNGVNIEYPNLMIN